MGGVAVRQRWRGLVLVGALVAGAGVVVLQVEGAPPAGAAALVGPGGFTPLGGARVLDTRTTGGALVAGELRSVQVTGMGGVPADGVAAVAVTVTATAAPVAGHVAVFPDGTDWPGTSTVNFVAGQTIANQAMVAVSADGKVAVRSGVGAVQVLLDVTGWYAAGATPVAGGFVPVPARRLLDTRTTGTLTGSTSVATVPVAGAGDVPANASAAVVNITAVRPDTDTYLTAWPAGTTRPVTSLLNAKRGTVVANLAILGVGSGGAISVSPGGAARVDVLVDLVGYQVAGPAAPGGIQPVPPRRLIDTRQVTGGLVRSGESVQARLTGRAGIPLNRVSAVVVTITAVPATGTAGYLTAWPSGAGRPATSALNPVQDRSVAATGVYAIGADGGLSFFNYTGTVHLLVDITGFVVAPAPTVGAAQLGANLAPLTGTDRVRARALLAGTNKHILRTWWPGEGQAVAAAPNAANDGWRRVSMTAFSLAVALGTGGYDPVATGVDPAAATATAVRMIDIVAAGHRANKPSGWGGTWQAGHNSSIAGRAAWLIWAELPDVTKDRVARMIEWEADQAVLVPTRYYRNRAGTTLNGGDSGAEENSWFALSPALAAAMFPAHPHRAAWVNRQEQLQIAAWARPSAVSSGSLVDGRSLTSWLGGSNVEPSGAVVNHKRIAPDYATTIYQNIDTLFMATLAGRSAPQSVTWGLHPVYTAQTNVTYRTPTYRSPGGTVYSRTSSAIYYPQESDWGHGQQLPYALADTQAQLFGFDATRTATGHAQRHSAAAAAQQARNSSGAVYVGTGEYTYLGREQHSAQLAGQLYLSWFVHDRLSTSVVSTPAPWSPGARLLTSLVAGTAGTGSMAPFDESILQER